MGIRLLVRKPLQIQPLPPSTRALYHHHSQHGTHALPRVADTDPGIRAPGPKPKTQNPTPWTACREMKPEPLGQVPTVWGLGLRPKSYPGQPLRSVVKPAQGLTRPPHPPPTLNPNLNTWTYTPNPRTCQNHVLVVVPPPPELKTAPF